MAKGMGLRLRLAVGLRLEMVPPLSPNWARRSQKIATVQSPFTLGRAECQRVASGGSGVGIDRLFNWLRCLPHPASSYPPLKQRSKWSDVDKAHPRQRRRLNCRTFYSRTYFKVCASATASAPRRSYRSSCCLPAEVTIPLPLSRAAGHGHRQSQHKRCSGGLQIIFVMLSHTKIPNVWSNLGIFSTTDMYIIDYMSVTITTIVHRWHC